MRPRSLFSSITLLSVLLLGVTACGGDDDSSTAESTTTTAAADDGATDADTDSGSDSGSGDEPGAAPAYADHATEVYEDDAAWICRPDLADDECRDLRTTTLEADGSEAVDEREPATDPPIDCFYVYPTVSSDEGAVADREWGPEDNEALTVVAQAAQYGQACRVFAPVYQQITLGGLGTATPEEREVAYADVLDAWKTYISRWNEGRGVILIGHSQGTGHLVRLIAEEVDDTPELQDLLVSAHLFGNSVKAPEGELVGGSFQSIPACTEADEAGCVVTFSSYPADAPPGDGAIFGRADEEGRSLCVDPVALLGGESGNAVAPVGAPLIGQLAGAEDIETPFVALPGAVTVSCETTEDHDYLAVALAGDADPRPVEGLVTETLGSSWGLHLVDMNVVLDDLVALAIRQADAFAG